MPEEIAKLNSPRLKTSKAVLEVFARASQHDQLTGREIISKLSEILGIEDIHSLRGRINPILDRFVDSGLIVKEELAAPRDSSRFGYRISAKGRAQLEAGQIPRRKALLSTPSERELPPRAHDGLPSAGQAFADSPHGEAAGQSLKDVLKNGLAEEVSVEKGEKVFSTEAGVPYVFHIMSGTVMVNRIDASGRVLGAGILMSGDIVRDLPNNDYTWTGTAITTVTFRRARRSEFDASVRNSGEAASELAQNIDTQLQRARDLMTSSQKVTVRAKAAAFLLWAHKTLSTSAVPDDGRFDFPFTLEDVSALVGVTRPRLSRNLKQLSREGVIQYTTAGKDRRSSFRVLDVERLKAIANE